MSRETFLVSCAPKRFESAMRASGAAASDADPDVSGILTALLDVPGECGTRSRVEQRGQKSRDW